MGFLRDGDGGLLLPHPSLPLLGNLSSPFLLFEQPTTHNRQIRMETAMAPRYVTSALLNLNFLIVS